jgi:drug/metabolite transporter (DMT)-like permease
VASEHPTRAGQQEAFLRRRNRTATLLAPVAVVAIGGTWALQYALAKLAINGGAHPLGLAFWEGFGSGLLILAGQRLVVRRRVPLGRRDLLLYTITGLLGLTLPATAVFWAARYLPVGIVSLLFALVPMLTYVLALALRQDRLAGARLLGLSAGLAGVLLIVVPEASLPAPGLAGWVLLGLGGGLCYALQAVYVTRCAPLAMDATTLGGASLTIGGLLLLPATLALDAFVLPLPAWGIIQSATVGIVLVNAVCVAGFFVLLRRAGPVVAAQTSYSLTLAGVLWGVWLFDERHSAWIWAALALLLLGLGLVRSHKLHQPA